MKRFALKTFAALVALLLFGLGSVQAIWAPMNNVPVERLLQNANEKLKAAPKDAGVHYLLGRLYSLKFAQMTNAQVYDANGQVRFASFSSLKVNRASAEPLKDEELEALRKSLSHYCQAKTLNPEDQLSKLGLAWMIEQAIPYADQLKSLPWSKEKADRKGLTNLALTINRKLFRTLKESDLQKESSGGLPEEFISREAGAAVIRLLEMQGKAEGNKKEIDEIEALMETINKKPRWVTPIIFSVDRKASFGDLIDNDARARFNLAGDDVKRTWPWITRNAAYLVWDPKNSGKIDSGRQLFGSATFWMFFHNGYEALASLDNDRNGWLEAKELKGIAVWHDKNGNAVSDPGEVTPVAVFGIAAIRAKLGGMMGEMPFQETGIRWTDGSTSATYDWVPTSKG